jgi:hypothetical protein
VSFDVFAWVLAHEVALCVLYREARMLAPHSAARAVLCSVPTETLKRRVRLRMNWRGGRVVL